MKVAIAILILIVLLSCTKTEPLTVRCMLNFLHCNSFSIFILFSFFSTWPLPELPCLKSCLEDRVLI